MNMALGLMAMGCLLLALNVRRTLGCTGELGVIPTDPSAFLKSLLGGSAEVGSLTDGRIFENIGRPGDLECSFDSVCQWGSDGDHDNPWYKVTGNPDPNLWRTYTGTSQMPNGDFAIHGKLAGKESDWLMSDFIGCQDGGGFLEFRYWLYTPATFKVCTVPVGSSNGRRKSSRRTLWCSRVISRTDPLGSGPGEYSGIDIPDQDEPFMIAIVPVADGGFVAIDDLNYDANDVQCLEPTEPPVFTEPPDVINCEKIECNFDAGNQCSWIGLGSSSGASRTFSTRDRSLGNRDTGVRWYPRRPGYEGKYAGVLLQGRGDNGADGDVAILESEGFDLTESRILKMRYWEATAGQQIRVAVDRLDNVVWESNRHVTIQDRNWQEVEIPLQRGVDKIFIIGENHGDNIGAMGVDDIQLLVPRGGDSACP